MVPNTLDRDQEIRAEELFKKYPDIISGLITMEELDQLHEDALRNYDEEQYEKDCQERQVGGDHYKEYAIQPIDIIIQNKLSFLEGCILKRLHRWRHKGTPIEDLNKMKHEIDLLIKLEAIPEIDRGGGCRE